MTFREDRWFGGATTLPASFVKGSQYNIRSASPAGRSVPLWKLWSAHIVDSASPAETIIVLPDARNIPVGGPVFVFALTGDPGVPSIRFKDAAFLGGPSFSLPTCVTWYLVENSTKQGQWVYRVQGFLIATPAVRPYIVSFGSNTTAGTTDSYNYDTDAWLAPVVYGVSFDQGGASTAIFESLIRHDKIVYGYNPVTVTLAQLTVSGLAKCVEVAFTPQFIAGTDDHWCFGTLDPVSAVSDIFDRFTNTFTSIIYLPFGNGFTQCTATASRNGPGEMLIVCYGARASGHIPFAFEAWQTFPQFHFVIQNTSWQHKYRAPMVTLNRRMHVFGGGSNDQATAPSGTQWHDVYQSEGLLGWASRPIVPIPLRGQGLSVVPRTDDRAILSMGRDNTAFPSVNALGWEYNDVSESYSARANKAWTGTEEQENSWAPASI